MRFSSLVLSRRPTIFKKRPKTIENPLTPIGSCWELHIAKSAGPLGPPGCLFATPSSARSKCNLCHTPGSFVSYHRNKGKQENRLTHLP